MDRGNSRGTAREPGDARRDSRRLFAALSQRYLGTALVGLAILVYWLFRLMAARWSG